jgi:mono/diheme cytochrome c family protein
VFSNLTTLTPHAGILPYELNVPFWSDNAIKRRWFSVPNPALPITFRATNNYSFPTGIVWIKHFDLELTNGVPESRRRLETRLLVRDSASGVYGLTYRWGDSSTNAALVADSGLNESFVIDDGGGILRTQMWRYPSRSECLVCHTPPTQGGLALGFNTPQLNRDFDYGGVVDNQLRALANAGYFSSPPTNIFALRSLPALTNEAWSVESRVRAYFAANCASCHLPGGPGRGNFDARPFRATSASGFIDGPLFENFGNPANRAIVSGSLSNSMILTRLTTPGIGRMPPLGSSVLDTQAIALVSRWITNALPSSVSFTNWQLLHFGSTNSPDALASADPDGDRARNYLEWLTSTGPTNALDFCQATMLRTGAVASITYPRQANRGFEVEWTTNLFATNLWRALAVPQNRPFFAATNGTGVVDDVITNGPARFYRVRVYEP